MLREPSQPLAKPNDAQWQRIVLLLQSLGMQFDISVERSDVQRTLTLTSPERDRLANNDAAFVLWLIRCAQSLRVRLAPVQVAANEAWNLIADGFCLVLADLQNPKASWWVFQSVGSNGIEAIELVDEIQSRKVTWMRFRQLLSNTDFTVFIAEPSLLSEGMSATSQPKAAEAHSVASHHRHVHHDDHHGSSVSPVRRVMRFLFREKNDLFSICVFSFFSVALSLATPLTVEVLVNTIGFGRNFQPIFYLALVLAGILFMSSAFKFLQVVVVELLQRRLFVRLVGDLAYRLPQVKRSALQGVHGPELLNRFFDIMTIQKSTATMMLDGATIIMQTVIGTMLLAFYHPYLLGFDVILILCMTIFMYLFGRGGIRTAIQESRVKYDVAHWLQDIIASPTAFKLHSGSELGADRTHRLTVDYLTARRQHFAVLIRQHVFSLFVLVAALTSLYALGGYLVIRGQLTLGQLVAAELVVGVIVGAFAKSGKLFESYFDLMSAVDKVGHLVDLPVEPAVVPIDSEPGPISVRAEGIVLHDPATHHDIEVGGFEVDPGESAAIVGSIGTADSLMLPAIAGLIQPARGFIELGGLDARDAIRFSDGRSIGYAGPIEIFQGTVAENIRLGRSGISDLEMRQALELVELWDELLQFGKGLETQLQTGGFPLGEDQKPRMMIARAIVGTPRLVLIDWSLDILPNPIRYRIWDRLRDRHQPWTLIVTTHDARIIKEADKDFRIDHTVTYEPSAEKPESGHI
jgi:putative ABC transport system ATP-binding protein